MDVESIYPNKVQTRPSSTFGFHCLDCFHCRKTYTWGWYHMDVYTYPLGHPLDLPSMCCTTMKVGLFMTLHGVGGVRGRGELRDHTHLVAKVGIYLSPPIEWSYSALWQSRLWFIAYASTHTFHHPVHGQTKKPSWMS